MYNMKPVKQTFTAADLPSNDVIAEDAISLASVETVANFREWIAVERRWIATPREERTTKYPMMPRIPSKTDYQHALAFEAL